MKLEKLETNNKKLKLAFIFGVIITASAFILINFLTSKAKYQKTESIKVVSGTINYKIPDLNMVAMYQDGKEITTMPTHGYVLDGESSYCYTTNANTHDTSVVIKTVEGYHAVQNLQKGSKCIFYFRPISSIQDIIDSYNHIPMPTITGVDTSTSSNKLYTTPDDHGTSYVFRGNVTDNWLRFANKTWRIIRINGDGTLRIIYQCGTNSCTDKTGDNTQLTTSAYNSNYNDNTYVGYYTGTLDNSTSHSTSYTNAHNNNGSPSTIAGYLNSWYTSNLQSYASYISGETGWCNDRELSPNYPGAGYGTNATTYAAADRFYDSSWTKLSRITPTLKCTNTSRDLFTTNTTSITTENKGNKKLAAPIGLITADEVAMAGGYPDTRTASYYLYTNKYYWTMSPSNFGYGDTRMFYVNSHGDLTYYDASFSSNGVRPVINLKSDITITGKGTESEPFIVS